MHATLYPCSIPPRFLSEAFSSAFQTITMNRITGPYTFLRHSQYVIPLTAFFGFWYGLRQVMYNADSHVEVQIKRPAIADAPAPSE